MPRTLVTIHFVTCMIRPFLLTTLASTILVLTNCTERSTALLTTDEAPVDALASADLQPRTVQLRPLYRQLQVHGRVTTDADQTAPVYPLVSGVVEQVPVQLGDQVVKGQVLALLRSSEVVELQNQRTVADIQRTSAQQQLTTAASLFDDGLASERDVAQAQAVYNKAAGEVKKLGKQLSVYNLTPDGLLALRAPIAGTITEKNVTPRTQFNQTNQERLFTISSLRQVWVMADVFQADVQMIQPGDTATVSTLAYPGQQFTGQVDKIFQLLNPQTKTMQVRIRLDNAALLLKPGMYTQVQVRGRVTGEVLPAVPRGSVLFVNGSRFVVVINDQQELTTREVAVRGTLGNFSYIASGLHPGERIATHNPLLLYSELNQ